MSNTELTPEIIEQVRSYLQKTQASDNTSSDTRKYYYVEWMGFSTVVPSTECESLDHAFMYATQERLQAWYVILDDFTVEKRVTEWNHNQYCDWLRRHYEST